MSKKSDEAISKFEADLKAGREPNLPDFIRRHHIKDEGLIGALVMLRALYDSKKDMEMPAGFEDGQKQLVEDLIAGRGPGRFRQRYMKPSDVPAPLTRERGGIPVVRLAAAGGPSICEPEALFSCDGWEKITRPFDLPHKEVFSVEIRGDSLEPLAPSGSKVIADTRREARPNSLCVVITTDYRACVKKVKISGSKVTLMSSNPAYPPLELDKKDVWKIYPVAWIRLK
jgi:SOS-response transcriptional repressor LexA